MPGRHPLPEGVLHDGGECHQQLDSQGLHPRAHAADHDAAARHRGGGPGGVAGHAPAPGARLGSAGNCRHCVFHGRGRLLQGGRFQHAVVPDLGWAHLLEQQLSLPARLCRRGPSAAGWWHSARRGCHEGCWPRGPRVLHAGDPQLQRLAGPEYRGLRHPQAAEEGRPSELGHDRLRGRAPFRPHHLLCLGHEAAVQQQRAAPAVDSDGRDVCAEVHRRCGRAAHGRGRHADPGGKVHAKPHQVVEVEVAITNPCCRRASTTAAGLRQASRGHVLVVQVRASRPAQAAFRGRGGGQDRLHPLRGERLLLRHRRLPGALRGFHAPGGAPASRGGPFADLRGAR
mmetsp:Transcript_14256/g.44529  ORF Transcript_14256/g.44529 Transcript_14256/m.44529 type:complete len:342 (+) Transcript_14256:1451-2476(+)